MGIGLLIARVIDFYVILIVVYAVMGWFVGMTSGGVVYDLYRVLASICEPFVGLFRRVLPPLRVGSGGIDFSPLIAILVLQFVSYFVATAL